MNKRSMKKGFPVRLLALLLCCFCLLSAIPTQVLATEEVTPPAQEEVTPAPAGNEGADASKDLTTENTSKTEEPKTEESKTEPPKTEEPKTEEPKTEDPKTEEPKTEEPKTEEPKTEEPKTEESKTETPKTEEPKTEEPKTEEPEVEEPTLSLYDRIMACETVEEVNTILDNLTEEESQEMEQFTEEQQAALEQKLESIGYYEEGLLDLRYTIQKGNSQNVSVSNIVSSDFSYDVDPAQSGITISYQSGRYNQSSGYRISVGSNVPAGDYRVTVKYKVGSGSTYTEHEDNFIVHVVDRQNSRDQYYSQRYYANPAPEHVAWDVVGRYDNNQKPSAGMDNAQSYVKSVKMNSIDVTWAESDTDYPYPSRQDSNPRRAGETLDKYFGTNVTKDTPSQDATLTIEPMPGYYITGYWIVCTNNETPYDCAVMGDGNEHHASFTFADSGGGAVEDTVWSEYFGHPDDDDDQYFIIVSVAPVPTPLFVDYNYGIIKDQVAESDKALFTTPTSWTAADSRNVYEIGKVDTQNTQFRYAYTASKPQDASQWKHYANSVTSQAKLAAVKAGYYFAGWKAEYYTTAYDTSISNDPDGKNYNYNLSNKYGDEIYYNETDNVTLLMHVKLIAQWKPIELKVTKVVTGLEDGFLVDHNYTIQVQKQNGETWEDYQEVTLTVNGNGTASQTLSPIQPGTYRAIETGGNGNLTGSTTIMYITVSDGGQVTYSTEEIKTSQELIVTNAYSPKPATQKLTIVKKITGNMQDPDKTFPFTVTATGTTGTMTMNGNSATSFTFNLGKGGSATIEVPVGATVTVTENPGTYTPSYSSEVTGTEVDQQDPRAYGTTFTMPSTDCTVTFTNDKTVQIQTAVNMDFAPYVLLLTVVAFGALLLLRKRRVV